MRWDLIVSGAIHLIEALREGVAAGDIDPNDLQALQQSMDSLKASRDQAIDDWKNTAPPGNT